MPKYQIQNSQLQTILNSLSEVHDRFPALSLLLDDKIKRLQNNNAILIRLIGRKRDELVELYAAKDENGKPKTEKDKDDVLVYVFNSPEDETAYIEAHKEFMNRTITIEI